MKEKTVGEATAKVGVAKMAVCVAGGGKVAVGSSGAGCVAAF